VAEQAQRHADGVASDDRLTDQLNLRRELEFDDSTEDRRSE
jgi:hypothetical protein